MRLIAMSICTLALVSGPAIAQEGNQVTGGGVSVETSPGGITAQYNNENDAQAACVTARGTFTNTAGTLRCANPTTPLECAAVGSGSSNITPPAGVVASSPTTTTSVAGAAINASKSNVKSPPLVAAPSPTTTTPLEGAAVSIVAPSPTTTTPPR